MADIQYLAPGPSGQEAQPAAAQAVQPAAEQDPPAQAQPVVENVAQAAQAAAGQENQQQPGQNEQGELEVKSICRFFLYMKCLQKGGLQSLVF